MTTLSTESAGPSVLNILTSRSVRQSAMSSLTCRSASLIKAFGRFHRTTLPYVELTLEEDKGSVGQSHFDSRSFCDSCMTQ